MNTPIKQHYIQKAYLNEWGDSSGEIYVCDLKNGSIRKGSAKSMAYKEYYYCFYDPEHPEQQFELENFLGKEVESPTNPIIRKIISDKEISQTEKDQLALYVAFQKGRTPWFEKFSNKLSEKMDRELLIKMLNSEEEYNEFLKDSAEDFAKLEKVPTREELVLIIEKGKLVFEYSRGHSIQQMVKVALLLTELYATKQWAVLSPEKGDFITSDNPAVTVLFGKDRGVNETSFPLGPNRCLLIDQKKNGEVIFVTESEDGVDEINRRTLLHATNFIFGNSREVLEKCYKEYLDLKPLYEKIHAGTGIEVEPFVVKQKLFIKRNFE